MARKKHGFLLRWLLGVLRLAFWVAAAFVLVCLLGSLRFLQPGVNPTVSDFSAFGTAVLCALGLFVVFYVYDTWLDAPEVEEWESAATRAAVIPLDVIPSDPSGTRTTK